MKMQNHAASVRSLVVASGLGVALTLAACGGGGGGGGNEPVSLADANAVMSSLDGKVNGDSVTDAQVPAVNALEPKVESAGPDTSAVTGDAVVLPVSVQTGSALAALYAKVPGAGTWFMVQPPPPPGGKTVLIPKTSAKTAISFNLVQVVNFAVTLPKLDTTGTDGKLCFEFRAETVDGQVTGSAADGRACIAVVSERPQPAANDQPSTAALPGALAGNWASPCIDIEDFQADADGDGTDETYRTADVALNFGASTTYSQSFRLYQATACGGSPLDLVPFDGNYTAGDAALNTLTNTWQRPIDFVPNDPNGLGLRTCFNRLRLEGSSTLLLGLPLTFSVAGEASEGDCRTTGTRPESVLTSFPLSR